MLSTMGVLGQENVMQHRKSAEIPGVDNKVEDYKSRNFADNFEV